MARKRFQPVIRYARLSTPGISAYGMAQLGNALNNSIQARWDRAQTNYDAAAPPLTKGYQDRKEKKLGVTTRDLRFTGRLRRSMRLLSAAQNVAVIGFTDATSQQRMVFNQRRSRMYGVSPRNTEELIAAYHEIAERSTLLAGGSAGLNVSQSQVA